MLVHAEKRPSRCKSAIRWLEHCRTCTPTRNDADPWNRRRAAIAGKSITKKIQGIHYGDNN